MIVECAECEAKVDGKVLGEHENYIDEIGEHSKVILLSCPVCNSPILAGSDLIQVDYDEYNWTKPNRLWPDPIQHIDFNIPNIVRRALEDAKKCFQAKVYSATAVMCGKAIEAICVEKTGEKTLHKGLKSLKDKEIIDSRLYDWGEALRKERNIGAHATEETITKANAQDVLDFAIAICEYIYVLTDKYNEYVERKQKEEEKKKKKKKKKAPNKPMSLGY